MEATTEKTESIDAPDETPPPPSKPSKRRRNELLAVGGIALIVGLCLGALYTNDSLTAAEQAEIQRDNDAGVRDEAYDEGRADANADHLDALETARTEGYDAGHAAAEREAATAAAEQQAAEEQAAAEAAAAEAARGIGPGTLVVGQDVQPGRYQTEAGADIMDSCYWARLSNVSGDFDAIIANGNATGLTTVEIAAGDVAFETDCTWQPVG